MRFVIKNNTLSLSIKNPFVIFSLVGWLAVVILFLLSSAPIQASGPNYTQGTQAYKASRYTYAIKLFKKDLEKSPEDAYTHFYLGLCYAKTNEKTLAKQAFEKVVQIENMKAFDSHRSQPNRTLIAKANKNIAVMTNKQLKSSGGSRKANAIIKTHAGKKDNYLTHALQTNGKVAHWELSKMPLKIYIASGQGVSGWRPSMNQAIIQAMGVWHRASQKKIRFKLTRNQKEADIIVKWRRNFGHNRVGVNPFESIGNKIVRSDMIIATSYPNGAPLGMGEIQGTAIHELGHALGIQGHSPYPQDIMFFSQNPTQGQTLTSRDAKTIRLLYQQKADISNSTSASPSQTKQVYQLINQGNQQLVNYPEKALSYYQQASRIDPRNQDVVKSIEIAQYNLGVQVMNEGVVAAKRKNKYQAQIKFREAVRIFETLSKSSTSPSGTAQNLNSARKNLQLFSR